MQIIHAPGVRDWTPENLRPWFSQWEPEIYIAAQRGEARHPLQSIIEDALSIEAGDSHNLTLTNGPTGIAPDVAAYLAGEPDCMIDADYCKTHRGPVRVFADISTNTTYSAEEVAVHLANIARAVYSVGLVRPVTVTFLATGRASLKHKDSAALLPEIDSFSCIDAGLLALIADPRTAREHLYYNVLPDTRKTGRVKWTAYPAKFVGVNIPPLKLGQRAPTVAELIDLINN